MAESKEFCVRDERDVVVQLDLLVIIGREDELVDGDLVEAGVDGSEEDFLWFF